MADCRLPQGGRVAQEKYQVLILGHGEIGQAVEHLLAPRHAVRIWERRKESPENLVRAAVACDFAVFCIPAVPHFELASRLRPHLPSHAICISVAKGLDDAGRNAAQVFDQVLRTQPFGMLCGPMIAEEIRRDRPAFAEFATPSDEVYDRVQRLFEGSALRVERAHDALATAWTAVLKNVYAIAFGMADGLDLGDNVRGYLAVAALREIESVVLYLTGRRPPPFQLAALGDLVTCATSAGSHHHEVGLRLAHGDAGPITGEGVHSVEMLMRQGALSAGPFPLYGLVAAALRERADVRGNFLRFLDARI